MTKRLFDIVLSLFLIITLMPIFLLVGLLVRIKLGSPILFSQVRPGLNGAPFVMHKFRTMTDARDASGALLADDDRVTEFGMFLRRTSIDELPEFWNILKGDMSFVGPRPLLMEYLDLYSERQARRHEVRAGLTGLAQVSGRNQIAWDERLELDVRYVENVCWKLDLEILLKTLFVTLRSEGITDGKSATMSKFKGS